MDEQERKLYEDYDDALFSIIMYQVAKEEGKRLLEENQRLIDEGFEVPESLNKKCMETIRRAERKKKRTHYTRSIWNAAKMTLVAAAMMSLLLNVACAAVPEFRASVLNLLLKVTEVGTEVRVGSGPLPAAADITFEFSYIPEGFTIFQQELGLEPYVCYADLNSDGYNFSANAYTQGPDGVLTVDTEDAEVTEMDIHGYEGMYIEKTDSIKGYLCVQYLWLDTDLNMIFTFDSYGLSLEESQEVFESLTIKK